MIIENPVYEKWADIERKYDGFCVFLANCIGNTVEPEGGEVWAYNRSLGKLMDAVYRFIEDERYNVGLYTTVTLTGFENTGGVLQVVNMDD